jgi:hypothetical protein
VAKVSKDVYGLTDCPLSAGDLVSILEPHFSYFEELWDRGIENERYRMGKNLSSEQEQDYYNQDRIPFPSAITSDKLSRLVGSEILSTTSAKAEATKPESEIKAELLTLRFKKVEADSEFADIGSEIFESGVAMIYGVGKIVVDYDKHGNKVVKVIDVDYRNSIWDSSARKYDKADGSFMAERKAVYRRDIAKDYGEEIAKNISLNDPYFGRPAGDYWGVSDKFNNRDNDIINIYEHYQKVLRELYYVVWDGEIISKESTKKEAEEIVRMLKIPLLAANIEIPPVDIQKHTDIGFDRYIFNRSLILEYERTDLEAYPYEIYQAFNFKDKIWCMTDILKPENKFMDKLMSQIDYAFGADLKNGWEIVTSWLDTGISFDEAITDLKNGVPIPVLRPGTVKSIPHKGANAQWIMVYDMLKNNITEYSGGPLFSTGQQPGIKREAKETVARKLRQQEVIAGLFIHNLRKWKRKLFKKIVWYLDKYDTDEYIMKVHGGNLTPGMIDLLKQNDIFEQSETNENVGYLRMNQEGNEMSWLKDADVEIIIKEENISDTDKEVQFARMTDMERSDPELLLSPTWKRLKLDKIDVSYEDRQKVINEIEQAKQQQAQQAQQEKMTELNMEQQKIDTNKAKALISDKGQIIPSVKK